MLIKVWIKSLRPFSIEGQTQLWNDSVFNKIKRRIGHPNEFISFVRSWGSFILQFCITLFAVTCFPIYFNVTSMLEYIRYLHTYISIFINILVHNSKNINITVCTDIYKHQMLRAPRKYGYRYIIASQLFKHFNKYLLGSVRNSLSYNYVC